MNSKLDKLEARGSMRSMLGSRLSALSILGTAEVVVAGASGPPSVAGFAARATERWEQEALGGLE